MRTVAQPSNAPIRANTGTSKILRKTWGRFFFYVAASIIALLVIFPIFWMISVSLRPESEIYVYPPSLFPVTIRWQNFVDVWSNPRMQTGLYFWNTTIYATVRTFFQLLLSSMAAFVLARYRFWGRDTIFGVILATVMIPSIVAMVPLFIMLRHVPLAGGNNIMGVGGIGWLNSFYGLILPGVVSGYSIFFLRQFFLTLSRDLEDAARVDGCSEFDVYWRIVLPMSMPALVALGIFSFQFAWSDFEWPLIITTGESIKTLQLGLAVFSSLDRTEWSLMMAGSVISTIPLLLLFALLQRFIVSGINFGVGK
jgi:multiple sugar transport system permease protein